MSIYSSVPQVGKIREKLCEGRNSSVNINTSKKGSSQKQVWMVRHGDSCSNLISRVDDHRHKSLALWTFKHTLFSDPRLSDEGRLQAELLGGVLPKNITRIYTSYMKRAIETAQVAIRELKHPVTIVPLPYCVEIQSNHPSKYP